MQRDYLDPIQDFLLWRERDARRQGYRQLGDSGIPAFYIPLSALRAYFQNSTRLKGTLNALFHDDTDRAPRASVVWDRYLRVLAILMSIKQGPMILQFIKGKDDMFQDSLLPFAPDSANFPRAADCDLPGSFCQEQWQYCPVNMRRYTNNELSSQRILPFQVEKAMDDGCGANVHKICVDEEYNELNSGSDREPLSERRNIFAMSIYQGCEAKGYCKLKTRRFNQLNLESKAQGIVTWHATFVQNDVCHMITEYADQGNLIEYMQNNEPPSTGEDIISFWERLLRLSLGLHFICHVPVNEIQDSSLKGASAWHNDIKPENILVASRGQTAYECDFLLAGLGLKELKEARGCVPHNVISDIRAYGAPETSQPDPPVNSPYVPLRVLHSADMWSLGCILSDCATWVVQGRTKMTEYPRRRRNALVRKLGEGYGESFHDGITTLVVVEEHHANLISCCREDDFITAEVLQHLVGNLLQADADERDDAKIIEFRGRKLIEEARNELAIYRETGLPSPCSANSLRESTNEDPDPSDTNSESDGTRRDEQQQGTADNRRRKFRPSTKIEQPHLAVSQVIEQRERCVNSRISERLPDAWLLEELRDRHAVVIVDNSQSMLPHQEDSRKVLEVLLHIIMPCDPVGVDLTFTHGPTNFKSSSKIEQMLKSFDKSRWQGHTNMQSKLGEKLDEYGDILVSRKHSSFRRRISRKFRAPAPLRRLSLYILTDGIWMPNTDLKTPIESIVTILKDKHLVNRQVGIQFIVFGTDKGAREYLEYLDDKLGQELGMDIVDMTLSTANVWKMLLGAVNNWFDDTPST